MGKSKELAELGQVVTQDGGNVGIGSNPIASSKVLVTHSGSTFDAVRVNSDTVTDNTGIYLRTTGTAGISFGSTSSLAFFGGGAGLTERMRIDASGRVTMPYQPAFRAFQTTDPTTDRNLTAASGVNWSVQYNRGNHFSDGTFTAPVDGVYAFSVMWDALAALSRLNLLRNGSAYASWEPTGLATASWESHYYGSHVYLSASDYVYLELVNSSGSNPAHMGGGFWGHFSGYLVG